MTKTKHVEEEALQAYGNYLEPLRDQKENLVSLGMTYHGVILIF
jgi:hypothetical protein